MGGAELADRRVREFDERGYVVIRGLVSEAELGPMLASYLAAARGERTLAGWNDRLQPGQIVQLGDPSAKLGWRAMPYFERIGALGPGAGRRRHGVGLRPDVQKRLVRGLTLGAVQ